MYQGAISVASFQNFTSTLSRQNTTNRMVIMNFVYSMNFTIYLFTSRNRVQKCAFLLVCRPIARLGFGVFGSIIFVRFVVYSIFYKMTNE